MGETTAPVLRIRLLADWVAPAYGDDGAKASEHVNLSALNLPEAEENNQWATGTLHANVSVTISNPSAFGTLEAGKEYYIDITPVDAS